MSRSNSPDLQPGERLRRGKATFTYLGQRDGVDWWRVEGSKVDLGFEDDAGRFRDGGTNASYEFAEPMDWFRGRGFRRV